MTKVVLSAEKLNHHPTIINTYNDVTLRLVIHDAGEVMDKDPLLRPLLIIFTEID